MAGSMGQAGMGPYYSPAAYGSISASMAAAAAAAAQQTAISGLGAPAQISHISFHYSSKHVKLPYEKYWEV
ncbi:hypothetical protein M0802_001334 [Mischocyttarus mexicanus]|nr:hypothetical protein M0802_001334 [Mischocyttarus mexicanus]